MSPNNGNNEQLLKLEALSKVIRVPSYEKHEDPNDWMQLFESCVSTLGIDEETKLKIVPGYLNAVSIRRWFFDQNFTTWNAFKEEFMDRYENNKGSPNIILGQIMNIKKKDDETLHLYIDRFDHLFMAYNRASKGKTGVVVLKEDMLTEVFIEGIRPVINKIMIKQAKPTSLKEAKKLALDLEGQETEDDKTSINRWPDDPYKSDDENTENPKTASNAKGVTNTTSSKRNSISNQHQTKHSKNRDANQKDDIEAKFDTLTSYMQKLTLLMEDKDKVKPKEVFCYNCQESGHTASVCAQHCKLCNGSKGSHAYWDCELYVPKNKNFFNKDNKNYLVEDYDECEENLMADKRDRSNSDRDIRKSRSGKRLKVHDTVPKRSQKAKTAEPSQPMVVDRPPRNVISQPVKEAAQVRSSEVSQPRKEVKHRKTVQNDDALEMEKITKEIVEAKVFPCSISQLKEFKGFRTAMYQNLRKKQKNPNKKKRKDQVYHIDDGQVRGPEQRIPGTGAPRTTAIVNGTLKVEAIMDSGSHGSVISLRLANELGLSPDKSKARSHILADGGSIANLGEIQSLVVQIQNVKIRVHPVVFEKPTYDLLLGSEAMELLGITADYGRKYFSIRSNDGIEPLIVKFNSGTHKMEKIPSASDSTDYDTFEEESYDTESPDDTDSEESYLLMFDHGPGEENFMVNNEEVMPISDAQAPDRSTHEEIMNILDQAVSKCELNGEQKEEMRKLLAKYTDVFGLDYQDLRQTNLLKLHIDTGDHAPVMKRPNRYMSHSELESLRSEIDSMLKNGQIVPATYGPNKKGVNSGGWAFPIMYVKKKNTSEKRLVVQFQDLNALTIKDPWPLPSITDLLETYEGASFFSTMDLLKGFNQIAVDDESIPKLTMATPWGCFSYKVMPFGIVNGPATFSRAIYLAMQGYLNEFVSTYIDDITVYSASFGEHILHLEKILQRIREVSMVLKPNKCHFAKSEVEVLGFVVSKGGIKPHQQNVEKVINFPKPKNKTDIRAFISLAGFYRRHVQGFSEVAEPLNKLLKKSEPFKWTESQEQAFIALKECIVKATQLKFPDPHEPYKLYTDASEIGVGAVLEINCC
ncbi:hypothetical protein G6F21_011489 [Rhizopus arrhizus]|nr:hypothetical protein G6F21_011489 [Rhizopus arrhizus]KAG0933762.1 hypothetical protein G6F32_010960 [Rhizopus arrhizus]